MRLVRVRFEKPLPAFGTVECKEPEYVISEFGGSVAIASKTKTVVVPWNRIVEADTDDTESFGLLFNLAVRRLQHPEQEAESEPEPAPGLKSEAAMRLEESKADEAGTVEPPKRRRRR